jgi:lysophospholipase L1-like esterase
MKRFGAGLVLGALVLVSLSCSSSASSSSPSSPTTGTAAPSTTTIGSTLAKGEKYVALGSSIASGFGISVQSTDCGRSSRNYPHLIARRYGLALTDVTCGAATIPNVLDTPQAAHPPQLTAVTPDTKLITVTVGGNDIVYNGTAVACGDPKSVCKAPATLASNLATTRTALETMLERIHAAAPSATVVFITYPREVPDGNCAALSFTTEEAAVVRTMGEKLEAIFVDVARHADVIFVDPYVAPGDHTGCAPAAQRWTAGHVPDDGFAYHPTALGHQVMAQMIEDKLGT